MHILLPSVSAYNMVTSSLTFLFFPFPDDHEVDVIGYGAGGGSGGSDDDHSSIRSGGSSEGSACGVAITTKWTRHLTLGEAGESI